MTLRHIVLACATLALVCLSDGVLRAQSERGTIRGLIVDATNSAIERVSVTATNVDTGVTTASISDRDGLYSLLNLPPGRYDLAFEKDGFRPLVHAMTVGVQSALRLDVTLQVGGVRDSVTVNATSPLLDSRSGATGTTLQNAVITNLPLNITSGRSIENFAYAIAPGVEGNNWTSNIVGGAPFTKEVILDGTSATIQIQGHITESSPPMEAVQEFKIDTSGMPAEYGRTGGGVFNFSLRSGTNALHGSAYGQFRHEAFDANTWMNDYLASADPANTDLYAKPRDRQQLGGVSLGGPVRENKTFYFLSFEEY